MAAISYYSYLRYLEADSIQEQSEVLRGLANDVHYAASILRYKVYDFESRYLALKEAAKSTQPCNGSISMDQQTENVGCRIKQTVKNSAMMLDVAQQVKSGLKQLIQMVREDPEFTQAAAKDKEWKNEEDITIESEATANKKADLGTPLEEQFAKELTEARRIYVDASKFIPINFRAVSTPIQGRCKIDLRKDEDVQQVPKVHSISGEAMSRVQDATKVLKSVVHPRRSRGRPRGSKKKQFSHVEVPSGLSIKEKNKDLDRSRSPPRSCEAEEMDKELLAWIPKKIGVACLPVDENLKALLMHEARRN